MKSLADSCAACGETIRFFDIGKGPWFDKDRGFHHLREELDLHHNAYPSSPTLRYLHDRWESEGMKP